jgi:hypothetical protein
MRGNMVLITLAASSPIASRQDQDIVRFHGDGSQIQAAAKE